jgi:signal transduction histidine kinase
VKADDLRFHILAAALIGTTILLMWFGYRATAEWQRSTRMLVEQRTLEVTTLAITAISRDMRGVQAQVLPQLDPIEPQSEPYVLGDEVAKVFARFPYPESFFSWSAAENGGGTFYVFNRADRPPVWRRANGETAEFPAAIVRDPPELADLLGLVKRQAALRTRFVIFETRIAGDTYQIIARPVYRGPRNATLFSVVGFMVNIGWVRTNYFSELTSQLSRIFGGENSLALDIVDENGNVVTSSRPAAARGSAREITAREQRFPLFFFDPVLRATAADDLLPLRTWAARVEALPDQSMLAAASGARRTFVVVSLAAIAAVVALLLTVRAARAAAILATMKSEFVSTVTHELKTPLSSIRLVSETLARGRFTSSEKILEYAGLLLADVKRLTRTVDNLLTFSRIADVQRFYSFEPVDPVVLLEDALHRFDPQLREQNFEVAFDVPVSLPTVRADRTALLQVLENLLDNAIRYSNGTRYIGISASAAAGKVRLQITDKGRGIPADEVPRVFEKFFRGREAAAAGTGLGLAIADRIIKDHHGEIYLNSVAGTGTTAEVTLPAAAAQGQS